MRVYGLAPTVLPLTGPAGKAGLADNQTLAEELAKLGYPGFAYLRTRQRAKNPAEVLLTALAMDDLEPRLTEALPWLLLEYRDLDAGWLSAQARLANLQNRLGFVVNLGRRVAESLPRYADRVRALLELEQELRRSRLADEDTLCQASLPAAKRRWLEQNRPPEAVYWHLLTDWRPEALRYVA